MDLRLPIALSNRHVHLSKDDLEQLFGKNYDLSPVKDLSQPGQFACEETVDLIGPKGRIDRVRVLGPVRGESQVEISISDAYKLGLDPVIRQSGDLASTPGGKLSGPKGEISLKQGFIVASRHIHMHTDDLARMGLEDGDIVKVESSGNRGLVFNNVLVRGREDFFLEMHVDIEEGNSAGIKNGDLVSILR